MQRFLALLAAASLAAPAAALATRAVPGDGTLSVQDGRGSVSIVARGSVIGQFDHGSVVIETPRPDEAATPVVSGFEHVVRLSDTKVQYSGTDVRFRVIGGFFRLRVSGSGVDLSLVGRGSVTLAGAGTADDGSYSTDGGDSYRAVPSLPVSLQLGQPQPAAGAGGGAAPSSGPLGLASP